MILQWGDKRPKPQYSSIRFLFFICYGIIMGAFKTNSHPCTVLLWGMPRYALTSISTTGQLSVNYTLVGEKEGYPKVAKLAAAFLLILYRYYEYL